MSNPEDCHNVLASCSRVDEAAIATLSLLDLPSELILRIASLLEIGDLLALRRIHKSMYNVTQDKLLWRGLLRHLRPPLPRTLKSRHLDSLSYPELEEVVLHSRKVEQQWLKRRQHSWTFCVMREHAWTRRLDFLDDRWVVYIPTQGPPTIWDTREIPPKSFELTSYPFLDVTWDATVVVDPHQGDIIIGFEEEVSAFQVLRVHLAEPKSDYPQLTDHGILHSDSKILGLEPSGSTVLIIRHLYPDIEVYDWTHDRGIVIETIEESILGLRLVGDYILWVTSNWLHLRYVSPLPNAGERVVSERDLTSRPFHLKCGETSFSSALLSEPQPNPKSPDNSRVVYILACPPIVGLFYFRVTIYNPDYSPSGARARMEIDLAGVYKMYGPQVGVRMYEPHAAYSLSLGPEGKRGTWIERPSNFKEFVAAASFDQSCPGCIPVESGDDLEELYKNAPRIEVSNVFELSQDLHDAIIRCAFSESTGKIVLGTRNSRIILL